MGGPAWAAWRGREPEPTEALKEKNATSSRSPQARNPAGSKFGNVEVAKFVNVLMLRGKKSVAERIIYGAFEQIKTKSGKDPLEVFTVALSTTSSRWSK